MLEIRDLRKKYDNGPEALRGVDLIVKEGEVLSLIGPSGAGKSTLIRCINRLVEPSSGQIFLGGTDICELKTKELRHTRKRMGMIFQEYALVERLSVMENVLSGRLGSVSFMQSLRRRYPSEYVEEALRLLDRVGLSDYVDTRADQLSGGQRQRVGICRALLQDPDLLLVDEPTASLDPKTAREIMRLIAELVHERKIAAVINLHEITLAEMFTQRVIGLKEGKIVYDKPAGNLTTDHLTLIYGEEDWAESPEPPSESESEEVS